MSFNETIIAHAITGLRALKDGSAQMCVTSPPYFGLRAYGTPPQVWGGDPDCQHEWSGSIAKLPIGGGTGKSGLMRDGRSEDSRAKLQKEAVVRSSVPASISVCCLGCGAWRGELGQEPTPDMYIGHLVSVFREVRQVLRNDGTLWLNLGDSYAGSRKGQNGDGREHSNIGKKQQTNRGAVVGGLPVYTGLPAKNLLGIPWRTAIALQADGWILRNAIIWHKPNPMPSSQRDRFTNSYEHLFLFSKSNKCYFDMEAVMEAAAGYTRKGGHAPSTAGGSTTNGVGSTTLHQMAVETRTPRDVWTIPTVSYKGAHFATFPPKLVEPCIKAGSHVGGLVIDPFGGSGTVGMVARQLGRNSVCIDLNADYADLSKQRIAA